MNSYLLVFIGGGAGSVLRLLLGEWLRRESRSGIPWHTLSANMLASFLLGLLMAALMFKSGVREQERLLVGAGFCGGLSTFSTFSLETLELIRQGQHALALGYISLSIISCLAAVAIGWWLVKSV